MVHRDPLRQPFLSRVRFGNVSFFIRRGNGRVFGLMVTFKGGQLRHTGAFLDRERRGLR